MKTPIVLAMLLTTLTVSARNEERVPPTITVSNKFKNPDGTVTAKSLRLLRGGKSYVMDGLSDNQGICKTLGFTDYLPNSVVLENNFDERALINSAGKFDNLLGMDGEAVTEITCHNGPFKKNAFSVKRIKNLDGTTTLVDPLLLRGNLSYPISDKSDMTMVCRAIGFTHYLPDSSDFVVDRSKKAEFTTFGNYELSTSESIHVIQEITCYREN